MVIPWWPTQNWFPIMWTIPSFSAEESHIDTSVLREQITSTVPQTPASSHTFIRNAMGD